VGYEQKYNLYKATGGREYPAAGGFFAFCLQNRDDSCHPALKAV